jgi:hypothetical protein
LSDQKKLAPCLEMAVTKVFVPRQTDELYSSEIVGFCFTFSKIIAESPGQPFKEEVTLYEPEFNKLALKPIEFPIPVNCDGPVHE